MMQMVMNLVKTTRKTNNTKPRQWRGKKYLAIPAQLGSGEFRNLLGKVTLQAIRLVLVEQVHFHTLVDQGDRAGQQFFRSSFVASVAQLLDRGPGGQEPIAVAQATNSILADSLLGTGVISHIDLYFLRVLKNWIANIGSTEKNKKIFPRFPSTFYKFPDRNHIYISSLWKEEALIAQWISS